MKYELHIKANEGYAADQVRHTVTAGDLREMLEGLNDEDEIVTRDLNNQRGASFGSVSRYLTEVDEDDDIDDIEEYISEGK